MTQKIRSGFKARNGLPINLERELAQLNAEAGAITEEEAYEIIQAFGDILDRKDFDEIRLALETLIYYIELDEDDVYIHWKFI